MQTREKLVLMFTYYADRILGLHYRHQLIFTCCLCIYILLLLMHQRKLCHDYRTILSDGDSVAFRAVEGARQHWENRLVSRLQCVNHVHKRMGNALRKLVMEESSVERGDGRLTLQKCDRFQGYFGGVLSSYKNEVPFLFQTYCCKDAFLVSSVNCV